MYSLSSAYVTKFLILCFQASGDKKRSHLAVANEDYLMIIFITFETEGFYLLCHHIYCD